FGYEAGQVNTANNNTFIGSLAGLSNTTGSSNTFVGDEAGEDTTTGGRNSFFGRWSGNSNTTGADNTFVGFNSALLNMTGTGNTFVGLFAGSFNTDGDDNTVIGSNANVTSGSSLSHATAIGADAVVSSSNTLQLGRTNGFDTVRVSGLIVVGGLGVSGATDVCRNASNQLSTCSSSLRYKSNAQSFFGGLDVVRRLRPITFNWKESGMRDVGFAAEEVEQIEPLLSIYNDNGEIEGVKYKQITTVLVNATNEQQTQIETQARQIEEQQKQIDALIKLVCISNPQADICKDEK
ncbi:MAG: tail fiber domain-containing protein, partial [Pyrinomonadaceae bacterium]